MSKVIRRFEELDAERAQESTQQAAPPTEYFMLPDDDYYHCPECDDGTWYVNASGLYACASCGLQMWGSDLFAS